MTKNEMIIEVQQILPVLSSAEIEEYCGMLDYAEDEPEPEGFVPTKAEMTDIVAWRLRKCTKSQLKTLLIEMKQTAEMRLRRKYEIMQALSNAGLTNVQTDVPVPADKNHWTACLALVFSDRYGCLASKSGFNGDHGEDNSCGGDEQIPEIICFYGSPVLASVCGRNFTKAFGLPSVSQRKLAEKLQKMQENHVFAKMKLMQCVMPMGSAFVTEYAQHLQISGGTN